MLDLQQPRSGYDASRFWYDLIISSYGLVFPAYMYLCGAPPTLRAVRRKVCAALGRHDAGGDAPVLPGFIGFAEPRYGLIPSGAADPVAPYVAGQWLPSCRVPVRSRVGQ